MCCSMPISDCVVVCDVLCLCVCVCVYVCAVMCGEVCAFPGSSPAEGLVPEGSGRSGQM
jgi:hypothetical protein